MTGAGAKVALPISVGSNVPCVVKAGAGIANARCIEQQVQKNCFCPHARSAVDNLLVTLGPRKIEAQHKKTFNKKTTEGADLVQQRAEERTNLERLQKRAQVLADKGVLHEGPASSVMQARAMRGEATAIGLQLPASRPSLPCQFVPLEQLEENDDNPRKVFSGIAELAESIKARGILQPLLIRPRGPGKYQVIAGNRRRRAAIVAGLREVPAIIRSVGDDEAFELALLENLQREDMSPVEEAEAIDRLMRTSGLTVTGVAARLNLAAKTVYSILQVLKLDPVVRAIVVEKRLSRTLALQVGKLPVDEQAAAAELFSDSGKDGAPLSIRAASGLVRQARREHAAKEGKAAPPPQVKAPTERVREMLERWYACSPSERRVFVQRIAADLEQLRSSTTTSGGREGTRP